MQPGIIIAICLIIWPEEHPQKFSAADSLHSRAVTNWIFVGNESQVDVRTRLMCLMFRLMMFRIPLQAI